ncbi:MAG: DUF1778 domain-containing protein [Actinobacteria bacterium]|nr:DUF1778 domain-containing protein [Actinomycetota bacterium]
MTTRFDDPGASKTERLNVRLSPRQRALLEAASASEGTTISEFVLAHATRAAETALADRRVFALAPDQWDAFVAALDRPERELPRLRKLLESHTVLDEV